MAEIKIHHGDSRDILKTLADNSIDSVVTDPPYALVSIGKRFGADNAAPAKSGKSGAYARASAGFMGQKWDTGETAFDPEFWAEVLRVLKPGGFLVAASGTRTYHRLACAIEDSGFEIRDMISWLYGSGFPKSHDVAKGIDKALGVQGSYGAPKSAAHAGWIDRGQMRGGEGDPGYQRPWMDDPAAVDKAARLYVAGSPEAAAWEGWGTALKPACEPWVLARKQLDGTVAANVLRWGVGGLNIDGCRVEGAFESGWSKSGSKASENVAMSGGNYEREPKPDSYKGRWPANVIHDGSDEVVEAFPNSASDDQGSASRFFYTAKADATDRLGTRHPTVKPTDLMQYLIRLVTPPGGTVLDCFAGSGSTGVAAVFEGRDAILIEREESYIADIERRVAWAKGDGKLTMLEKKQTVAKANTGIEKSLFE